MMPSHHGLTRRGFLGAMSAAAAVLAGTRLRAPRVLAHGAGRQQRSFDLREQAALTELRAVAAAEGDNGDEARYPNFIGSYSKGLPHKANGEVEPNVYRAYRRALLALPDTGPFARLPLGGSEKLVNPMAGVAFDLEGVDIQKPAAPRAPQLASARRATEMVELYWMALCRDIPFRQYESHPLALAATAELRTSPRALFRGNLAGDPVGPHVSQLLLTPFDYGQYHLDGRLTTFAAGADYLTDYSAWLACRNGQGPFGAPQFDATPRYFRCGRDLAAYVHSDQACEGFYNAGLRLYALQAPLNPGNPYLALKNLPSPPGARPRPAVSENVGHRT